MSTSGSKGYGGLVIGCGGVLLVIALGVTLFCAFHVFIDPDGAISDDEAMPGLLGGVVCLLIDIGLIVLGSVLRKRAVPAAAAGAAMAMPGAPQAGGQMGYPGAQSGYPGAQMGYPGAQMGYPGAPQPGPKKPFPTHLLSGCGSVIVLLLALGGVGAGLYFFDRAASARRYAEEDERRELIEGRRSYGLGPDFWRRREREREQYGYGGLICGVLGLLLTVGGVILTVSLSKKNKAKAVALASQSIPPAGGQPPAGGWGPPGQGGGQAPPYGGQAPPHGGQAPPYGGQAPPSGGQNDPFAS